MPSLKDTKLTLVNIAATSGANYIQIILVTFTYVLYGPIRKLSISVSHTMQSRLYPICMYTHAAITASVIHMSENCLTLQTVTELHSPPLIKSYIYNNNKDRDSEIKLNGLMKEILVGW